MYHTSTLVFTIWVFSISLALCIFSMNEVCTNKPPFITFLHTYFPYLQTLYYYQVKVPKDILRGNPNYEIPTAKPVQDKEKLTLHYRLNRYFSLQPTWPNTDDREYAYYYHYYYHVLK